MKAIVINMDSAIERMDFQSRQLQSLGIEYERLSAFTIRDATDPIYQKYYNKWQRPLGITEVSCFFSHKTAWQKILENNQPMLILEDDAWLDPAVPVILEKLEIMKGVDYITLEVTGSNRKKMLSKEPIDSYRDYKIYRLFQGRSGAGGYVLWPKGAKKLLKRFQSGKIGLADKFINSAYSLKAFQIDPAVIIQLDQCNYFNIEPPLKVKTSISTETESPENFYNFILFRVKRIMGEISIAVNLIKNSFRGSRRKLTLSKYFREHS